MRVRERMIRRKKTIGVGDWKCGRGTAYAASVPK